MPKDKVKIIIIGGGASGMTAAIAARRRGADVTILERNSRVGKKILATGNGRCNLSNTDIDISRYHGKHPEFIYGPFSRFEYYRTMEFFEEMGISPKVEDGGKVYPLSEQASSVLDVLRYELDELGVEVILDAKVTDIKVYNGFDVYIEDGRVFHGDRVILAAGGKASPELGSNGSGFILAKKLGHSIVEPFPALVQLKLSAKFLKSIQGVKFDGDVEIFAGDKAIRKETGEILFTEYGISGPPVMQISRCASEHLASGDKVYLKVTMINYMDDNELEDFLARRLQSGAKKQLSFNFVGFINKRLVPVILKEALIDDINKPSGEVTKDERNRILNILRNWGFEVTGTNTWSAAQVTAGGVDVYEVNSKTLESKVVKGLYLCGEVLDIDGDCGGFNLQWAWSSGFVAGESAAASSVHA